MDTQLPKLAGNSQFHTTLGKEQDESLTVGGLAGAPLEQIKVAVSPQLYVGCEGCTLPEKTGGLHVIPAKVKLSSMIRC